MASSRSASAVVRQLSPTRLRHPVFRIKASLWPATTPWLQRGLHSSSPMRHGSEPPSSSNPAMAFPCLDAVESRSKKLSEKLAAAASSTPPTAASPNATASSMSGPEPTYTVGQTQSFHCRDALYLDWGGVLPEYTIAYETWGTLNPQRSNAILLHTGLSASSHARSTPANPQPGWWEPFIGPGAPLDTSKYFVVCTNVLGGCFGSTGPSSIDPANGERYATRFPVLTMQDMVRAQFSLLDHLGIKTLHASVGSSMGGMQALAAGTLFPERVGRLASISGCARSHPYSIAMRHVQRQVLMMDPNWRRGFYYDGVPPHAGMKLARQIATVTYRSGPEWELRFGRRRADASKPPALCPDYLIETYLDHAGEKWCLSYDANSLLYVSKAMDLFDLGAESQNAAALRRASPSTTKQTMGPACNLTLPEAPYTESPTQLDAPPSPQTSLPTAPPIDLVHGLRSLCDTPTLILGVASDILFPSWQQREVADALRRGGNRRVTHVELSEEQSLFGHDTFLLDLDHVGGSLRQFLES